SEYYYEDSSPHRLIEILNYLDNIPKEPTVCSIELDDLNAEGNISNEFKEKNPYALIVLYLRSYKYINTLIDIHNDLVRRDQFSLIESQNPTVMNLQTTSESISLSKLEPIKRLNPIIILMNVQDRPTEINLEYHISNNLPQQNMSQVRESYFR